MASATISEIKSYFMGNVGTSNKKQEVSGSESFSQVFDKTQESQSDNNSSGNSVKMEKTEKSGDDNSIQNHANIQKKNAPDKLKETTGEDKEDQAVEEAVEEAAEAMVNKVAETFEVSVEEVETILEALGLTSLDLLNCENLVKIVAELNPGTDALTIMTDEQLFADLKGLMNTAQDLLGQMQQDFQMSEEDMTALLASMQETIHAESVVEEQSLESAVIVGNEVEITVENEVEVVQDDITEYKQTSQLQEQTEEAVNSVSDHKATEITEKSERHSETRDNSQSGAGQNFAQNFVNQLAEAVDQVNASQTTAYGVNGQEIISQITEYIKIHVNMETTEMELQLHPASLGNIKVQIASAEGMLTATFTTENEAVKSVLEAQLIQLKESFEQQGLKVNSVEVNVAAQGFERSLDQQEQGSFQEKRQKGQRRIRLTGLEGMEDGIPEGMYQDDEIVADMMIRNGNTVDYTV